MFDLVQKFIVEKINVKPEEIQQDTQLIHLGLDSMKLLMIIGDFENQFNVKISDRQLESIHSVNDLVQLIEK